MPSKLIRTFVMCHNGWTLTACYACRADIDLFFNFHQRSRGQALACNWTFHQQAMPFTLVITQLLITTIIHKLDFPIGNMYWISQRWLIESNTARHVKLFVELLKRRLCE